MALYCSLSVSVCGNVYCGTQGHYKVLKLYCRGPKRGLPIHFFTHFCCRMYRLATNGKINWSDQKETSVWNRKQSVAKPNVICSTLVIKATAELLILFGWRQDSVLFLLVVELTTRKSDSLHCFICSSFMNSSFDSSSHKTFSRQQQRSSSTRVLFCRHECILSYFILIRL